MKAEELMGLVMNRLRRLSRALSELDECALQLQITDALSASGRRAFMEYPHPHVRGRIDIAVTDAKDCSEVSDWIEIKPIWQKWNYWNPSKFFDQGAAPFKHDIRKLAGITKGSRWFMLALISDSALTIDGPISNPRVGKALSAAQIVKAISLWTGARPALCRRIPNGREPAHIVLWKITKCRNVTFKPSKGEYLLSAPRLLRRAIKF